MILAEEIPRRFAICLTLFGFQTIWPTNSQIDNRRAYACIDVLLMNLAG
jgi:hypothetical protein